MSEVNINYKGSKIAGMDVSGTKTLLTQGKYCEDDIEVVYTKPAAPTPSLQSKSKSYTPTETAQSETVSADSGYDGLDTVSISVGAISSTYVGSGIVRRDHDDLYGVYDDGVYQIGGDSGYYPLSFYKTVPSGTAGTPTATKGTVSNHSISVTPSVTNTAGYISGGTINGTAVTVTASELASGNKAITSNGTNIDVVGYSTVSVDVQGGGTPMRIDGKDAEVTSTSNSITFTNLMGEPTSFYIYNEDNITPSATSCVSALVFDGTTIHGQTVTNISNAQATYDGSSFTKSYSNGTLTITSTNPSFISGWYDIIYSYGGGAVDTKDVQVGSGATSITFTGLEGEPAYWSCIFKSNFGTSSGYQRVIWTGSNQFGTGVYGASLDSSTHMSSTFWTASYNNGSFTITSQGTNAGGYFHQPGYYQLTYAYDDGSSGNYQSKTVTPTTSQQVVQADSGYDALKKVTVNAIPSEYIVPSGNIAITSNTATGQTLNVAQYATATVAVPTGGGSVNIATETMTNSSNQNTTISFTLPSGRTPKAFFARLTSQIARNSNSRYYYVFDMRWDGSSTGGVAGNTFYMYNGTLTNVTSGYSYSQSGTTFTLSSTGSRSASPGSFYNGTYELVYIY